MTSRTPDSIKESLSKDQYKLYKLIWERFVASQMPAALFETHSIKFNVGDCIFKTTGSLLKFDGFLKVYNKEDDEQDAIIPEFTKGQVLKLNKINPLQHFTQPPEMCIRDSRYRFKSSFEC